MSEEWKKDFFEWKDQIESKYNDLSESKIKCENKIEALEGKLSEWNEIMNISIKGNIDERIMSLKKITDAQVIVNEYHSKGFNNLEEVLRDQLKFRIKWSEKAIFVDGAERLSLDQVAHLEDQIKFYGELLEKLDSKLEKEKSENPYLDLGMITSKDGELSVYAPSQFVKDYAKTHISFSLYGLVFPEEASGGEKSVEVNNPMSSRSGMKASTVTDSKLPENPCSKCKYENPFVSDRCESCIDGGHVNFEPKEAEPEKEFEVIETIQAMINHEHMLVKQHKKEIQKLIEDAIKDLDELIAWSNNYPKDSEIYIRIKRKREKWQGKQK